jgi:hypothetical protein
MKAVINYRDQPVYFTYCGGMTKSNRIYLNAETGRIWVLPLRQQLPEASAGGRGADLPGAGKKPALPAETLVAQSQDFTEHRAAFVKAAKELIEDGRCTPRDFEKTGGWMKAVINYRDQPVYFTYCGGMTISNRIYLNAETGRIFSD